MKKIYSVALIMLAVWAPSVHAQTVECPGAVAIPVITATSARVIVFNMPPNTPILVVDANGHRLSPLPPVSTDANGNGSSFYNRNSTPAQVLAIGETGTCFAVVAAAIDLPIKLKSFTARLQQDNSVMLNWTSVLEANSSKYVIQKSTDGRNFSDLDELKAAGNSLATLNYSFNDRQILNGSAYYRLKLVDLDGTVDYTKIVYISNGDVMFTSLSVFPNPFRSEVQLKGVTTSEVNRKNIKVYNTMGSEVNYRVVGGNSIVIDPTVPKGVYILRVKGQAYKLFKE